MSSTGLPSLSAWSANLDVRGRQVTKWNPWGWDRGPASVRHQGPCTQCGHILCICKCIFQNLDVNTHFTCWEFIHIFDKCCSSQQSIWVAGFCLLVALSHHPDVSGPLCSHLFGTKATQLPGCPCGLGRWSQGRWSNSSAYQHLPGLLRKPCGKSLETPPPARKQSCLAVTCLRNFCAVCSQDKGSRVAHSVHSVDISSYKLRLKRLK